MNGTNLHFDTLLNHITATLQNYKDLNRLSGDSFNVFRILKMETNEVKMHSALLGDLLNPSGSHGQGKIFLDLFIAVCSSKHDNLDTANCSTYVEFNMGKMNEDRTEGGRIDIIIRDRSDKHIIIENKIYAPDQDNQLVRYFKTAKSLELFYLTLDGTLPSPASCIGLKAGEHFYCISYSYHIIKWLENCRKEVAILPILRESLTQYINLVKYLTGQTTNHQMQNKIATIIKDNLEASFTIYNNLNAALDLMVIEFGDQVKAAYADSEFTCSYEINLNQNYSGIWFYKEEWSFVKIGFQFQATNRDMLYGFTKHINELNQPIEIPKTLEEALSKLGNNIKKENSWWPWRQYIEEPYRNWTKLEAWEAIQNGKMLNVIQHHVKILSDIASEEKIATLMSFKHTESHS